jgi:hypothetical protein
MKIKLMSILLIAVWSLQGSEASTLVNTNPEAVIRQAFIDCIDSFQTGAQPLIVCFLNEMNNEKVYDMTFNIINDECKKIDKGLAKYMNISLYSYISTWGQSSEKIKNAASDVWEDLKKSKHKTLPAIMIYNVSGAQLKEDIKNINQLIETNKQAPLLITTTSLDDTFSVREMVVGRKQQLKGDRMLYFQLLAEAAKSSEATQTIDEQDLDAVGLGSDLSSSSKSKEDKKSSGDKSDDKKEQALLVSGEGDKEIIGDSQATSPQQVDSTSGSQNINPHDQPSYLSTLSNFFTNHWGKLAGGASLAAFLAYYYYNFVR